MANNAVIGVIIDAHEIHAVVSEGESVTAIKRLAFGLLHGGDAV